jgi:predicted nicotinamide N-methyase
VPGLDAIRLHLVDDILSLWHAVQLEQGDADPALPFWAVAWAGGLALAHYLREHPEAVAGRRVLDLASGSGLCAFAASQAGAAVVTAADIDPYAAAAIELNARANGCRVTVVQRDLLGGDAPDVDVILAGDCCYEAALADRLMPWLQRARSRGVKVLLGDPGRRYLPRDALIELAAYDVRTTSELDDLALRQGRVYALRPGSDAPPGRGEHGQI